MRKKEARSFFRQKRAAVTTIEKNKWDDLLLIQFQQLQLPFLTSMLSYYPSDDKGEADTFLLTRYLQFINPGLQVAFPRIRENAAMEAVVPDDADGFAPNAYGILEPVSGSVLPPDIFNLVLVPLLAYDEQGNRAGYGKGYYDRFLKECRSDCLKIGISYFEPVQQLEDANEYDVPLDLCITPQKAYVF